MAMLVTIHHGVVEDGRWAKGYIQNKTWYDNIWHACAIQYIYIYIYIYIIYICYITCIIDVLILSILIVIYTYIYICVGVCVSHVYIYIYKYVFFKYYTRVNRACIPSIQLIIWMCSRLPESNDLRASLAPTEESCWGHPDNVHVAVFEDWRGNLRLSRLLPVSVVWCLFFPMGGSSIVPVTSRASNIGPVIAGLTINLPTGVNRQVFLPSINWSTQLASIR